jgi:ketosteroid isomerase-like protein
MTSSNGGLLRRYARDEIDTPLLPVEQVQAAEDALSISMLTRDREAFADLLADDASLLICRRLLRGKAVTLRAMQPYFEGRHDSLCCEASRIEVLDGGALAFVSGVLLDDPGGQPVGAFESIWHREADGAWRIVFAQGTDVRVPVQDGA